MKSRRAAPLAAMLGVGCALVLGVAFACGGSGTPPPPPASSDGTGGAPVPAELAGGERLFDASCSRCHGPRASGTEQGPPLVHIVYEPNHHGDAAFLRAAAQGVPAHHWRFGDMPPVPGVTPEQVAEITAYIRWLQRQAGIG